MRAPFRLVAAPLAVSLASLLLLSGCLFGGGGGREPPRKLEPARSGLPSEHETRQCLARLRDQKIDFRSLPDRTSGNGCSVVGTVQLLDIGTPVSNLGAMRCGVAEVLAQWVREDVQPAARRDLGSPVVRVQSFGTYSCRGTVGNGAPVRLSEHAVADAVDIAAFELADGRKVSVLADWKDGDDDAVRFLHDVHDAACRRFITVLSPNYNAAHRNHFHFDMGGRRFCR